MFARFRNLFSKNKDDSELEAETDVSCENSGNYAETSSNVNGTSEESSKLEGLNLLKSIVESEQQGQNNGTVETSSEPSTSLSEEVAELLQKRLSKDEGQVSVNGEGNDSSQSTENETQVSEESCSTNEVTEDIEKFEEISKELQENEELDNEPKHTDNEVLSNSDQVNDLQNKTVEDAESTPDCINSQEVSSEESCEVSDDKDTENVSKPNDSNEESIENTETLKEPIELFISEKEDEVTDVSIPNQEEEKIAENSDLENVKETKEHIELYISENEEDSVPKDSSLKNEVSLAPELENSNETNKSAENEVTVENSPSEDKEHEEQVSEPNDSSLKNEDSEVTVENSPSEDKEHEEQVSEPNDSSLKNEDSEVTEAENSNETNESTETEVTVENSPLDPKQQEENIIETPDSSHTDKTEIENPIVASNSQELNAQPDNNTQANAPNSRDNSPEFSESSKSLSQSSVKENYAQSTTETLEQDLETNIPNNSSIVVEDIPSEITTPSPTVDSTISGGSGSNTSTLDSAVVNQMQDPSKIIVNPIDNNGLACNAINNKLNDIAEVAESLDAVIRDVQENVQTVEVESNPSPRDKKLGALRSTSSEDWHSRSTEDDSFATASEGNFTLHSSSSFQTASGRTSSYISCDKNSFDASEADDSTYAFEMPELTSPLNMSFEGSEQSYLSAQPLNNEQDKERTPTKLSESGSQNANPLEDDQSSIADVEELHSESVTPTPEQHYDGYHVDSIPVESETELEVAGIVNAPSLEIITEHTLMPMSKTPEVSPSTSTNVCSNQNPLTNTQMSVNEAPGSNDQQEQQNTNNNNNNNKPNAAWRRSKYYENITKQTIKGFL